MPPAVERCAAVAPLLMLWLGSQAAWAAAADDEAVMLAPMVVTVSEGSDRLSPSSFQARRILHEIPQSASVIDAASYQDGAVLSVADALSRTPGVWAQTGAGRQSLQLSVRGSGLASPLGVRGVMVLRDGIPLGQDDGVVNPWLADASEARYVEILRGAAGLRYGSAALGGAINVVSPTGRSHPGRSVLAETGSRGHRQLRLSAGESFDNGMDAYASVSYQEADGELGRPRERAARLQANLGMAWTPYSEGRLHIAMGRFRQDGAEPMTLAQALGQRRDGPLPDWPDSRVETDPYVRLAYQHAWQASASSQVLMGVWYGRSKLGLYGTAAPNQHDAVDYGFNLRTETRGSWLARPAAWVWGLTLRQGRGDAETRGPFHLPGGRLLDPDTSPYETIRTRSRTAQLFAEQTLALTPELAVTTGLHAMVTQRSRQVHALRNPPGLPWFQDLDDSASYRGLSPKLGLTWQATPQTQWYGSVSRSIEPPTTNEFYNSQGTVRAQRATTVEAGMRGENEHMYWEAGVFHSRIRDQLLSVRRPAGAPGQAFEGGNVDRSTHAGLELGLGGELRLDDGAGRIEWNVAHTYSRFRLGRGSGFDGNAVPGIPAHYGRLALTWRHPSGFHAGPALRYASSRYADQGNAVRVPGYGLVDFTVGYVAPGGYWRLYLDGRNLADKRYVTATDYLAEIADPARTLMAYPGARRTLVAGVQINW